MYSSPSPWFGVLTTLLVSLVLMNWLTCTQEFGLATLISLTFFTATTGAFLTWHKKQIDKRNAVKNAIEQSTAEPMQISKLKEQLKGCLQYGDTEKAEEISQRLVALNAPSEPGTSSY